MLLKLSILCRLLQIHATLPRLILHLHDKDLSVRLACRVCSCCFLSLTKHFLQHAYLNIRVLWKQNTFQLLAPLMEVDGLSLLLNKQYFTSDRRFVLNLPSYFS